MRILQVHNKYLFRGGEDIIRESELDLLVENGHDVEEFVVANDEIDLSSLSKSVATGLNTVWSQSAYRSLEKVVKDFKPDVVHVHNYFPRLSPSIFWAAKNNNATVVHTLYNYRFCCANPALLRDLLPCEECVGRTPFPALKHRCYRHSLPATFAVVAMQLIHKYLHTLHNKIDACISFTEFGRSIMIRSGFAPDKCLLKPNSVKDMLDEYSGGIKQRKQIVFVGRLSAEKGVDLLLQAWEALQPADYNLVIIGEGIEKESLSKRFSKLSNITWAGWFEYKQTLEEIGHSRFLVLPSRGYETFGMVLIEALMMGIPVIGPAQGGFPEIIEDKANGFLFEPNDTRSLSETLSTAMLMDGDDWQCMSNAARDKYLNCYTPEANYKRLMEIYQFAISQ